MQLDAPTIRLAGFGLTTANILYRLPDFPAVLQTFVWQHYDLAPAFPELCQFLEFWQREIEGRLHSVRVAHHVLVAEHEIRAVDAVFGLN